MLTGLSRALAYKALLSMYWPYIYFTPCAAKRIFQDMCASRSRWNAAFRLKIAVQQQCFYQNKKLSWHACFYWSGRSHWRIWMLYSSL